MDEEVARMKADHDAHIAELEARAWDTSQAEQKARIEAFRLTAAQMQSRINEATSVLTDAMSAWSELDEPPQRVDIQRNIQVIENTTMAMKEEMKSLAALQRIKKDKGDEPITAGSPAIENKGAAHHRPASTLPGANHRFSRRSGAEGEGVHYCP